MDEPWDSCRWFLNGAKEEVCAQYSVSVRIGDPIVCKTNIVNSTLNLNGGNYDFRDTCKLNMPKVDYDYAGNWTVVVGFTEGPEVNLNETKIFELMTTREPDVFFSKIDPEIAFVGKLLEITCTALYGQPISMGYEFLFDRYYI